MKRKMTVLAATTAVAVGACLSGFAADLRQASDTYLEGDGSQAIDVGCTVGPKTRIVTEIYYEAAASGSYTYYLFGVDGGRRDFVYLQNKDASLGACLNGTYGGPTVSTYMRSGVRYLHDFDNKSGKWKITTGTSGMTCASKNLTAGTATSTATLGVFTRGMGTSYDRGAPLMRVYSFKVYEDDVLIRDLIPYGYGALTGLVDRCTGKVYTDVRKSKKPFKIGTDAGYVVSDASCSEWIDTGYCLTPTTKIEADFSISQARANMTIFGAGGGEEAWCRLYADSSSPNNLCSGCQDGALGGAQLLQADGKNIVADGRRYKYVLDLPGNLEAVSFGNTTLHSAAPAHTITKAATVPLGIFAYPTADGSGKVTATYGGGVRIYSFKIWDNGVLIRDYVPRLVDNVAKLYDRQNQQYATVKTDAGPRWGGAIETLTSATDGKDPNSDAYLLSHDSEVIDTGCKLTSSSKFVMDYSWYNPVNGETQYACGLRSTPQAAVYRQKGNNILVCSDGKGGISWGGSNAGGVRTADERRTTLTIDVPGKRTTWAINGVETGWTTIPCLLQDSDVNFAVFGRSNGLSAEGKPTYGTDSGRLKLYSLLVYEGGVLQHEFVPAKENGVAGLKDLKTDNFVAKAVGSSDLELFSGGYNGAGLAFSKQPSGCTVELKGSSTLSAYAPGAYCYQWLRNGVPVEGATSPNLQVEWRKGSPYEDTYRCLALYSVFGYAVSDEVVVKNAKPGLAIAIR